MINIDRLINAMLTTKIEDGYLSIKTWDDSIEIGVHWKDGTWFVRTFTMDIIEYISSIMGQSIIIEHFVTEAKDKRKELLDK